MEEKFYSKKNITQYVSTISKKHFFLKYEIIEKILNLNDYNKRIFSKNLKETDPIFYKKIY
jgi:hypothetical protein